MVKLKFTELNGTDTIIITAVAGIDIVNYTHYTIYEEAQPIEVSYLPSWEELTSAIQKTFKYDKGNVYIKATWMRGDSRNGWNRCVFAGTLYTSMPIQPPYIYVGFQYPNDGWYGGGTLEAYASGRTVFIYDMNSKVVNCFEGRDSYITNGFNDVGKDFYTTRTILLKTNVSQKAGTYNNVDATYVGSTLIDSGRKDLPNAHIGTIVKVGGTYPAGSALIYEGLFGNNPPPQYPNSPDDDSEADPPVPGDGDTSSDPIPDPPSQPIFDINNTGFVTVYNPSATEIRQLAYFMWSGEFTDLIKKMFASPFEALISLKMLFVDVPAGTTQEVWLGNVETGVSMSKLAKQFIDVDMGTITINEFFGSFADYAPFTKIQIFLPFIGYKDLNVDEVMNASLHLRYRVDVYSGACIAFLTVTKTIKSTNLNSILYQFDGNCAMELPFTQNDNSRYVAAILNSAASSAMSLAASSTFTPPTVAQGFTKGESAKLQLGSLAPVANGMMDILSTKPNVQRAGSLAGAVASMGVKQPYVIIHRPIAQMPSNYQHYLGIPLNLTRKLSTVSGYTIVSQVFMTSAMATEEEITMITELLKSGVIF